jgi:hypothetical protein
MLHPPLPAPAVPTPPPTTKKSIIATSRADDAPIRQPSRGMINARVEEVRLSRTRTGGQIYKVHRRQNAAVSILYSE